jgi:putative flavoprotein involved in K+ transport
MQKEVEVLIIGAGQAGLAAAYYLKQKGQAFVVIDKGKETGEAWRKRYDSLVLFTPRWYSALPGLPLKGSLKGYATKDEVADYLQRYAEHFSIPIDFETEVMALTNDHHGFQVITNKGEYRAKKIIVATGPFQKPFIPKFAHAVSKDIYQVHTSSYANPSQLKEGAVLVIGAGNSGAQIAVELSKDREVFLSVGHKMKFLPLEIAGQSIFWWCRAFGVLNAHKQTRFGAWFSRQKDPIFGKDLERLMKQGKVSVKPKTISVQGDRFVFEDQTEIQVQNIIWATGFYSDYSWIQIPGAFDDTGKPINDRGISPVSGLYFLGLPWLHTRGSALIGGVGNDVEYISKFI